MELDIKEEIYEHYQRIKAVAEEAAEDTEENYSSRASALRALSSVQSELVKTQEKLINMERLARVEQATIEVVRKYLPKEAYEEFIAALEKSIGELDEQP